MGLISIGKITDALATNSFIPTLKAIENKPIIIPTSLKAGDRIGITSPAGWISKEDIDVAIITLKSWGFDVVIGNTIGKRNFTFGGTDKERKDDLQAMLDDDSIKVILCARGGYGLIRIIDQLNFSAFYKKPKWVIGFSDITILHNHIHNNFGIATIHSKMCNSFPKEFENEQQRLSIESIRLCLTGSTMKYKAPWNNHNKPGNCKGALIGGNLKTIESLSDSNSDVSTKGKILFVEDTQEYLYSIDRMFWNLKRSGKLDHLHGLIVGGFKIKPDEEGDQFGKMLEEIVLEKTQEYDYPICFDFPVGHQLYNMPLKCGVTHELIVNAEETTLKEITH